MNTPYTPGPWAIEAGQPGNSWYVQDAIGNDIARVRGGEETTEGNARLIAAAPELVEALRCILTFAEIDSDDGELALDALALIRPHARELLARIGGGARMT